MATEKLVIEVSEKGALVVKRNLEDIGKGAKTGATGVGLLQKAVGAIGAAALVASIIRLSDQFTNIQNRLRTVTKTQAELNAVTEELFAISNRTRSSFEGTAEIYARTALAAKDLGISQQQVLHFTESLNQAILLGGSNAQEANAGMIQLSQGLASGALRGDELRSVLEQLPVVADVIAKSLGVTRGELREMGMQGKITADVVLKAFEEARGELSDRFGKSLPTVGQAMQVLKNNVIGLVGSITTASGASSGLAEAILGIAEFIPKLKEPIMVFADTVVATFKGFANLFSTAGDALKGMGTSWTGIFTWIGNAILALLRTVTIVVDKIVGTLLGVAGFIVAATQAIATGDFAHAGELAGTAFMEAFNQNALTGILDGVIETVQEKAAIRKAEASMPKQAVDLSASAGTKAVKGAPEFDKYLKQLQDEAKLLQMTSREREIQADLLKAERALKDEATSGNLAQVESQLRINQALADQANLLDQINGPQDTYNRQLEALNAIQADISPAQYNEEKRKLVEALRESRPEFEKYLEQLRAEAALLGATPKEAAIQKELQAVSPGLSPDQATQVEAQLRINQSLAEQAQLLDEIKGPQREYENGLANLNAIQSSIAPEEYARKLRELKESYMDATNQIDLTAEVWNSVWNGATSALNDFTETGKLSFRDLSLSIIGDIQRIVQQMLLMSAFKAIGIPVPAFASGGSFMVGGSGGIDSQMVAFRASPDERVDVLTPYQQRQQENGGGSVVQSAPPVIKIINILDPSLVTDAMASDDGTEVIINTMTRNPEAVKQALS